jgi:hypothetical protein
MKFPLFIAHGDQAVVWVVGWFMIMPLATLLSLIACLCAWKRRKRWAIILGSLAIALSYTLTIDEPVIHAWVLPAGLGVFAITGTQFLKRTEHKKEANQPPVPTRGNGT